MLKGGLSGKMNLGECVFRGERKGIAFYSILWMMSCVISLIGSLIMVILFNTKGEYRCLFLLPLFYGGINIIFMGLCKYVQGSRVIIILVAGYFIKMVASPVLFALGNYDSFFDGCIRIQNIDEAVFFMLYEYLCVVSFLYIGMQKRKEKIRDRRVYLWVAFNRRMFLTLLLICVFLAFAYITVPAVSQVYYLPTDMALKNVAEIRWDNETIVERGTLERYFYSLFSFFWPIVRFFLPAVLIYHNYFKWGKQRKSILLSVLCVFIPFLFMGGDNLAMFLGAIFALIVMDKLYGKRCRKVLGLFVTVGIVGLVIILISKLDALTAWRGATGVTNIAQLLNAYFPGVDNVAACMSIQKGERLNTLFFDIYSGIPFAGTLFGLEGESLNDIYANFLKTGGQIVPWGCNIAYYFSYLLSPLLTGFFLLFVLNMEYKGEKAYGFWSYYMCMLFSTYTAFSVILYSTQIYNRFIWNIIIPVVVIMWLIRKKKLKWCD